MLNLFHEDFVERLFVVFETLSLRPAPGLMNPQVAMATISTIGALTIRIRFWGPLYYNYNKEPQQWYW